MFVGSLSPIITTVGHLLQNLPPTTTSGCGATGLL
jgi:hypothetical protein